MDTTSELPDHRSYTSITMEGEAAVGQIAIWAAWLEQNLVDLCAELINGRDLSIGHAVTANMSTASMISLAKKLVSESATISPEDKARTLAVLVQAKAALEQRNKVLHATVGGTLEPGMTAFYNSRRRMVPGVDGKLPQLEAALRSPSDLNDIGAQVHKAMDDVWECHASFGL